MIKLTLVDVEKVFLSLIQGMTTFREASDWASNLLREDRFDNLEIFPEKDLLKVISGLTILGGIDLEVSPGVYLYTLEDVIDQYHILFNDQSDKKKQQNGR